MQDENAPPTVNKLTPVILLTLALWLAYALTIGGSGFFYYVPPPMIGLFIWTPLVLLLAAYRLSPAFREWVFGIDWRALLMLHLTRFVGIYFLILHERGRLPYAFAVPGGWGDIAAAIGALLVAAWCAPPATKLRWRLFWLWNLLGLLDIIFVMLTALRLNLTNREAMLELTKLPLSLLPTFIVPLIIVSHIFMFLRLSKQKK